MLIDRFFIKVKFNSSDIFFRISSRIKHEIAIFIFLIVFVVLILLGSSIVNNNINITLSCFNSNEFN